MGFVYLAVPYSGLKPVERNIAVSRSFRASAWLMKEGFHPFNPVGFGHFLEGLVKMEVSHARWLAYARPFLAAASGLAVLIHPGWRESLGVQYEITYFLSVHRPISYLYPGKGEEPFVMEKAIREDIL